MRHAVVAVSPQRRSRRYASLTNDNAPTTGISLFNINIIIMALRYGLFTHDIEWWWPHVSHLIPRRSSDTHSPSGLIKFSPVISSAARYHRLPEKALSRFTLRKRGWFVTFTHARHLGHWCSRYYGDGFTVPIIALLHQWKMKLEYFTAISWL